MMRDDVKRIYIIYMYLHDVKRLIVKHMYAVLSISRIACKHLQKTKGNWDGPVGKALDLKA